MHSQDKEARGESGATDQIKDKDVPTKIEQHHVDPVPVVAETHHVEPVPVVAETHHVEPVPVVVETHHEPEPVAQLV